VRGSAICGGQVEVAHEVEGFFGAAGEPGLVFVVIVCGQEQLIFDPKTGKYLGNRRS
jgi:hypothetical protein